MVNVETHKLNANQTDDEVGLIYFRFSVKKTNVMPLSVIFTMADFNFMVEIREEYEEAIAQGKPVPNWHRYYADAAHYHVDKDKLERTRMKKIDKMRKLGHSVDNMQF